ncbi:CarD family transcriptional regulator [Falsiroseomonas sp. E2-1-a20]|uniref:CarD family transcriptional regulator n=1 Tax=Falsiroseomonas sp. E2-1-a20 TaxID=3239300 RepID=UPI003F30A22E
MKQTAQAKPGETGAAKAKPSSTEPATAEDKPAVKYGTAPQPVRQDSPPPPHRPPSRSGSGSSNAPRPPMYPPRGAPRVEDPEDGTPLPPPRPKGPPPEFKPGDHVVYPTHGVGQVQGIEEMPVAGMSLKVIIVTFEENRMTLRVPVNKAASSGLRKLATDEAMAEALEVLRGRARIKRTMWSRRAQEYEAKINSGDPLAIAEVVRDLHRNAGQPDQSFSERQIYEQALDRLAAELAAIDRTDKAAASEKLLTFLKAA